MFELNTSRQRKISAFSRSAFMMILLIGISAGCANPIPRSPVQTVGMFALAVNLRDSELAKSYCTESFISQKEFQIMETILQKGNSFVVFKTEDVPKTLKEKREYMIACESIYSQTMNGDSAKVWVQGIDFMSFSCIKQKGRWKISGMTIDTSPEKIKQGLENIKDMQERYQ